MAHGAKRSERRLPAPAERPPPSPGRDHPKTEPGLKEVEHLIQPVGEYPDSEGCGDGERGDGGRVPEAVSAIRRGARPCRVSRSRSPGASRATRASGRARSRRCTWVTTPNAPKPPTWSRVRS